MSPAADNIVEPEIMGGAGSLIASGQALQQMRTGYATSVRVQVPRDLEAVTEKCMTEAAMAGEAVFFGWGSGKNRVEGPSIDCAMLILRNWTNAACEVLSVEDNPRDWIFHCGFVDLETGVTFTRPYLQSKTSKIYGNLDDARAQSSRFAQGASKGMRNVTLKAVPTWLVEQVVEAGRAGAMAKLDKYIKDNTIEKARQQVMNALRRFGVKLEDMERKAEADYDDWGKHTILDLKADFAGIKNGNVSITEAFPPEKAEVPDSSLKDKLAKKANGADAAPPNVDQETGEVAEENEGGGSDSPEPAQPEQPDDEPPPPKKAPPEKAPPKETPPPAEKKAPAKKAAPAEKKPAPPAEKPAPGRTSLADLMAKTRDELNSLALERMMQATDARVLADQFGDFSETGGISPFMTAMLDEGTLRVADVGNTANNKGHLARLITIIEKLIEAGPSKDDGQQPELPY